MEQTFENPSLFVGLFCAYLLRSAVFIGCTATGVIVVAFLLSKLFFLKEGDREAKIWGGALFFKGLIVLMI